MSKMKLNMNMNVKATVENTYNSFHFANTGPSQLDEFYNKAQTSTGSGITHDISTYNCLLPYGSDDSDCSSEALCYSLNFYSERYMIAKKTYSTNTQQKTIFDDCIKKIFNILNTIIALNRDMPTTDSDGKSTNYVKTVAFPMWNFYNDGSKLKPDPEKPYSTSNATDSNIEILKSLLKLYIFNVNDVIPDSPLSQYLNYKSESSILIQYTFAFLGITINSGEPLSTVIKKMIVMMIYNLMSGEINPGGNSTGSFSTNNGIVTYGASIYGKTYPNYSGNIISNKYPDYINYGCFIYICQFFNLVGIDYKKPELITIKSIIPDADTTEKFPSWANTTSALTTFLDYINSNISSTTINTGNFIWTEDIYAELSRLSYQIVNLYILLKNGDVRLNMNADFCSGAWNFIVPNYNITTISTICSNLINCEISNKFLLLNKRDSIVNPKVISSGSSGSFGSYESNPTGFYRQLSYMCFKELSNTNFTQNPPRNDDNENYYFENHNFGYFGFNTNSSISTSNVIPKSLQELINKYSYTNFTQFYIDGFGNDKSDSSTWINNNSSWNNNNNPYFNFSLCSLHQINFYLYIKF